MCEKKALEVPVIIGKGEQQFFIEKEMCFNPPCPPVYSVKDIKKWVEVYDSATICGKVIFNAYLWKDICYTTIDKACCEALCGPVYHYTVKIPFGGFVDINDKVKDGDIAELVEACVVGAKDEWCGEAEKQNVKVYTKLVEKTVVKLKFKVSRLEEVFIETYEKEEEEEKDGCCEENKKEDYGCGC
jgi:hypothetical protein